MKIFYMKATIDLVTVFRWPRSIPQHKRAATTNCRACKQFFRSPYYTCSAERIQAHRHFYNLHCIRLVTSIHGWHTTFEIIRLCNSFIPVCVPTNNIPSFLLNIDDGMEKCTLDRAFVTHNDDIMHTVFPLTSVKITNWCAQILQVNYVISTIHSGIFPVIDLLYVRASVFIYEHCLQLSHVTLRYSYDMVLLVKGEGKQDVTWKWIVFTIHRWI